MAGAERSAMPRMRMAPRRQRCRGDASSAATRRETASGASRSSASRKSSAAFRPRVPPSRDSCGRDTGIRLPDQCNSRIIEGGNDIARAVGRTVIDHDQRPVAMRLCHDGRDRVADPRRRVERGNDNADVHPGECSHRLTRKP